jgi:basic membrane protein A
MYVTGAVWKWSKLYEDIAKKMLDGTYKAEPVAGGLKEGYVGLASFGPSVDGETQALARKVTADIVSGKLNVFAGPIYDTAGKIQVEKGKTLEVGQIISMGWLAKGVQGAPTK